MKGGGTLNDFGLWPAHCGAEARGNLAYGDQTDAEVACRHGRHAVLPRRADGRTLSGEAPR